MNSILDHIGKWNPQLLRELKSNFRWSNLIMTVGISLIPQLCLLVANLELYDTNQKFFCFVISEILAITVLVVGGNVLLNLNFQKEYQTGSMDFIKISPNSAASIILGKLLGVPSGIWFGIILQIPVHFWLGISAKITVSRILESYIMSLVMILFCQTLSLLFSGFLVKHATYIKNWVTFILIIGLEMIFINGSVMMSWYDPEKIVHTKGLDKLITFYMVILIYWIWIAIVRLFENPDNTHWTKSQGYVIWFIVHLMGLGLAITFGYVSISYPLISIIFNWIIFFLLNICLTPQKKFIIEWNNKYKYIDEIADKTQYYKELLWDDGSPVTLFTSINIILSVLFISIVLVSVISLGAPNSLEIAAYFLIVMVVGMFILRPIIQMILIRKDDWVLAEFWLIMLFFLAMIIQYSLIIISIILISNFRFQS